MKKIGMIGGIGWPSTVEYYRLICEASQKFYQSRKFEGPSPLPEITIESLNINYTVNNRGNEKHGSWDKWDAYFKSALHRLEASGTELALIASVTPHSRLSEIASGLSIPIISLFDCLGAYCEKANIERLLVLGTMPTMGSDVFVNALTSYGVEVLFPPTSAQKEQVEEVINALYQNKPVGAAEKINEIAKLCFQEEIGHNVAVCLGCTELPLAFPQEQGKPTFQYEGISYLNATVIHAAEAFSKCVE